MIDLETFFKEHPSVAIAFSGGVDSAYLLAEALKYAHRVQPYYVKSEFQPEFELEDAKRLCKELGCTMKILYLDALSDESVRKNPANRCYYCKKRIMGCIKAEARKDGFDIILDGTNASDDSQDRPGMKVLLEEHIYSPLRDAGLTKRKIRERSKELGLFTWNKSAYACLATRVPTGVEITKEILDSTEKSEGYLANIGFKDFRIRYLNGYAKLEIRKEDFPLLISNQDDIYSYLMQFYPKGVLLDLKVRNGH